MTFPPLSLLDGDTLFIDNSRLEYITMCLRASEYAIVRGQISADTNQAFIFGEAIHLALKLRYKYCLEKAVSDEFQVRQFLLLEEFFSTRPTPIGDHRTLGLAQEVINVYNREHTNEPFTILHKDNQPIVEQPFNFLIGTIQFRGRTVKVVWTGRIDLAIRDAGDIWVVDHKTTQVGGDYYFTEYPTSNQMKGYVNALVEILGLPVKGAMINAMVARKPTRTGKGIELMRAKFEYDEDMLAEWKINILHIISDFLHSYERGWFPMETKQCVHRYGRCQFLGVCSMSPSTRLTELTSGSFKQDSFSPLREDSLNLDKFATMEIPSNYQRVTVEQEKQQMSADLTSILNDLIK